MKTKSGEECKPAKPNSIHENELTHRLKSSQTAGKENDEKSDQAKQSDVQQSVKFSIPVYFKATEEVKPYSSIIASISAIKCECNQ